MKIFPKSVGDAVWQQHLKTYSKTLVAVEKEVREILPITLSSVSLYNVYVCPLCLKNYFADTESGIIGNAEFSLDHIPPQSAGGQFRLITCKTCNNNAGIFEAELERILNFGIDKTGQYRTTLKRVRVINAVTGESIYGDILHAGTRADIVFKDVLKQHNRTYKEFLAQLHSNQIPKIKLEIPLYDSQKVEQALLKSAYLICFIWWGYEFVFSENAALLRKVLCKEAKYPTDVPISWHTGDDAPPSGVSLLINGDERLAFVVNIQLQGIEVKTTASVIIPNPTKGGWAILYDIDEYSKAESAKEFTCVTVPRVVHRIGYTICWNIVLP